MKLEFHGHNERYVIEQSLLNLFPGELPVYGTAGPEDSAWAVISLSETENQCRVNVKISRSGKESQHICAGILSGSDYEREGLRRRLIGQCFFLAAEKLLDHMPPWGMLSGVRPDKLVTHALISGKTPEQAEIMLEQECFVTPERAKLAVETGSAACRTALSLRERDVCVYIGIPFCPTRCAYCSFVSQSVEKSFALIPPYVDALIEELKTGGETARRNQLRVRAFYMGGGTPTTLNAGQLQCVLDTFAGSFDLSECEEWTVEAGRPDTITEEKLSVLKTCGVTRISINPQSMRDTVLRTIGRRHSAEDIENAMRLAKKFDFRHINMDIIAGLPEDTPEGFAETLERCLAFGPDNLTVHTLALKKGSRVLTQRLSVPDAEAVREMLEYASETLRAAGYVPYYLYRQKYMSGSFENIGWCRPGAECLYNICMMSELCGILSFGAGGTAKLIRKASDSPKTEIHRLFNAKYPEEYLNRPEKWRDNLSAVDKFYTVHSP